VHRELITASEEVIKNKNRSGLENHTLNDFFWQKKGGPWGMSHLQG